MEGVNAERFRAGYEAFNKSGVGAILELLDPAIQVHDRPTLPDRATYHGWSGVQKLFEVMIEAFDDVQFEVEKVIDRGDNVIVGLRQLARGRNSGIRVAGETAHLWTLRNGRPIALTIFGTCDEALDALRRAEARESVNS